jgi:hypothetical protein
MDDSDKDITQDYDEILDMVILPPPPYPFPVE